jgi:hypothetical protein
MSSSQYLRNKMASMPKVLNTLKPLDSSDITTKKRLSSSRFFPINGQDKGTLREASDLETSKGKAPISTKKQTGQPRDSSDFTAYRGAVGIDKDLAYQRGRLLANSSSLGSISNCVAMARVIPTKDASTITRERLFCHQTKPPAHTTGQVGPPVFVDDTIRIPPVDPTKWCPSDPTKWCPSNANHSVKANVPFERTTHGPTKFSALGYQEGNDPPYKIGSLIPRPKYIEKHHGNDLLVNPKRLFVRYQGSALPVQRRDKPRFGDVKP